MMYCWTKAIQCTKGTENRMGIYLNSWLPEKASRNNSSTVSLRFFLTIILHCTMDRFFIGLNSGLVLVHLERDCLTEGGRTEEERSVRTKNTQGWWILCPLSSSGVVWCIALLDQKTIARTQTGRRICISITCGRHKYGLMELSVCAVAY